MELNPIYLVWLILVVPLLATLPEVAKILVYGRIARIVFLSTLALAALGIVLASNLADRRGPTLLVVPLAQLLLAHVTLRIFIRLEGRMPIDTFHNWNKGLLPDRIYALTVTIGGICPVLFILPSAA